MHATTIREDEVAALRCVHAAATTETDDEVDLELLGHVHAAIHIFRARVLPHFTKGTPLDPGTHEDADGTGDVACFDNPWITDDQRAPAA